MTGQFLQKLKSLSYVIMILLNSYLLLICFLQIINSSFLIKIKIEPIFVYSCSLTQMMRIILIFLLTSFWANGLKLPSKLKNQEKLLFEDLRYHDYEQLTDELKHLAKKYDNLLTLYKLDEVTH